MKDDTILKKKIRPASQVLESQLPFANGEEKVPCR